MGRWHIDPSDVTDTDKRKAQHLKCNPREQTEPAAEEGVAARTTGNHSYQKPRETGINSARFLEHRYEPGMVLGAETNETEPGRASWWRGPTAHCGSDSQQEAG